MIKKLMVFGLLLVISAGCGAEKDGATEDTQKTAATVRRVEKKDEKTTENRNLVEAKAENGEVFHYTLLNGWQKRTGDDSDISVTSSKAGVSVLFENKADYVDFASYQNGIISSVQSMGDQITEEAKDVEIQGLHGVEMVVESENEGNKQKGLLYLLEADQNFVQIYTTTNKTRFDKSRETLEKASSTFKKAE
ncbi:MULTISPECIES: hypothetical protein [Enterococcus]|uniref:hypothetical protein n=1 Tax=Enterococcus TaxID=1350 RepID=UPI0008CD8E49|nr:MULTISPECIES: hypothetical protein [Enterococcus]SET15882.1 hypothetical protein SAMN04487821_10716 [Enterococcus malodoratus]HCM87546.1 hypothetical protein [Enterococcus sp.]